MKENFIYSRIQKLWADELCILHFEYIIKSKNTQAYAIENIEAIEDSIE